MAAKVHMKHCLRMHTFISRIGNLILAQLVQNTTPELNYILIEI